MKNVNIELLPIVENGLFKISEQGDVFKLKYNCYHPSPKYLSNGYVATSAYVNGRQKHFYVHRLLALAYIPNPDNKLEVHFKDCDKTNLCLENLYWADNTDKAFIYSRLESKGTPCVACGILTTRENGICKKCEKRIINEDEERKILDKKLAMVSKILDSDSVGCERDKYILKQYADGKTLQEIGTVLGLSRERIRQILKRLEIGKRSKEITEKQKNISRFIHTVGINQSKLCCIAEVTYSQFLKMTSLQVNMPDDIYIKIKDFLHFQEA